MSNLAVTTAPVPFNLVGSVTDLLRAMHAVRHASSSVTVPQLAPQMVIQPGTSQPSNHQDQIEAVAEEIMPDLRVRCSMMKHR